MLPTVSETAIFQASAAAIWSEDELMQLRVWLARSPKEGDVVPGTGGVRKVRWQRPGMGKRGGARVLYFIGTDERVWLLMAYTKAKFDNLPTQLLKRLKEEVERVQYGI